jgi:tRNA A37 threonylcarbamoyladenosine dehydratase
MNLAHEDIFIREEALIGREGLKKLTAARVAICGLGGVGSYLAEALARSAIGHLLLIDCDTVTVSNINRQLCALHSTVGQNKADVVAARINDINPKCQVKIEKIFLDESSEIAKILQDIDYIGDAIDYMPGKIALITYAYHHKMPLISSMGAGRRLDPLKFSIADISKTFDCPMAKTLRQQLRTLGIHKGVQVVFSSEIPLPASAEYIGSIAFVPSVAGLVMASKIVKDIIEK